MKKERLFGMKIDFVVTWVDGSDKKWAEKRNEYSDKPVNPSRFRDWGFLKYWFRSIEKYAPWVNKIYFVTYGHLPDFLDINHEKLVVVKHEDFIPKQYLPTFSSHPIEFNLHRIEGLSEYFVYFNDDMYLNNPVSPEDFFKNGLPRDTAVINPVAPAFYGSIGNVMINNISILNNTFSKKKVIKSNPLKWFNYRYGVLNLLNLMFLPWGKFPGMYQPHLHSNFLKSEFENAWKDYEEILDATCKNKFRNTFTDVNQWMIKQYQILRGKFEPQSWKIGKYVMIKNSEDVDIACKAINKGEYKVVCINDHCDDKVFNEVQPRLIDAFEKKLSKNSKFEI